MRSTVSSNIRGGGDANVMDSGNYLVRFKGYSDAYNVWRPAALLQAQGCAEHISRYHQLFNLPLPLAEPSRGEGARGGGRTGGGRVA